MSKARVSIIAVATSLLLAGVPTNAAAACSHLRSGEIGTVVEVTDGDTVVLNTGVKVRMIGMQAPKLPLGREGFVTWPLADEARDALVDMALGQKVRLAYGGAEVDRHGRALAHVYIVGDDEIWAQRAMVAAGWARVYSFPDNRQCLDALYAAERQARVDRRGIWSLPYYNVRAADRPEALLERVGHYEIVEGRVFAAARSGKRVFLNFGRVWKEDFTALIERDGLQLFEDDGFDPLTLEGALVRVRGWVDDNGGPRITVTHPEQIELVARP